MRRTYNQMQPPSSYGNLSNTTGIVQEFGAPVEDIQRVTANMFQTHETNRMAFEELQLLAESDKELVRKEHESDVNIVNDRVSQIGTEINNFVDGGNFHNASKVLSKTFRKYVTDDGLNAAKGARAKQLEIMSQIDAMEGYSNEDKAKAKGIANSKTFNQAITRDENGNIVGGYYGWTPNEFVDPKELIKEFAANWKGDDITVEGYNIGRGQSMVGQNPFIEGSVTRRAGLSGEEYMEGVTNMLASDAKYQAYLNSKYMMDNFDPATGDIRVPNDNEMIGISYNNIPKLDTKTKKPIADDIRQKMAVEAYDGAVINLQNKYKENTGEELSREQAVKFLHKQEFISNEINNAAISLYHPYVHTISEQRQKLMADNIYTANYEKNLKSQMALYELGALPNNIDPIGLGKTIEAEKTELSKIDASINNLVSQLVDNPDNPILLSGLAAAKESKARVESVMAFKQHVLDNIHGNISPEIKAQTVSQVSRLIHGDGVRGVSEEAIKLALNGDESLLNEQLNSWQIEKEKFGAIRLGDPTYKSPARIVDDARSRVLSGRTNMYKSVGENLGWHNNIKVIYPEGNTTAEVQQSITNHIKNHGVFETIDGVSSSSDAYKKGLKGDEDITFNFVANTINGDIMGLVSYKDENGKIVKTSVIKPPIAPGLLNGVNRDLVETGRSTAFINFPEIARSNMEIGAGNLVGSYPVVNRGNMSFDTYINELALEASKPNNNPFNTYATLQVPKRSGGAVDLHISFVKNVNGKVEMYYSDEKVPTVNGWKPHGGSYNSPKDWTPTIYTYMRKIEAL